MSLRVAERVGRTNRPADRAPSRRRRRQPRNPRSPAPTRTEFAWSVEPARQRRRRSVALPPSSNLGGGIPEGRCSQRRSAWLPWPHAKRSAVLGLIACGVVIALGGPAGGVDERGAGPGAPVRDREDGLRERSAERHRHQPGERAAHDGHDANLEGLGVLVQVRVSERSGHPLGEGAPKCGRDHTLLRETRRHLRPASGQARGSATAPVTAKDGSVVVRKDFKVLNVDISQLTGKLGTKPALDAVRWSP